MCLSIALSVSKDMKLHFFSDASEKAIAPVAYLVLQEHQALDLSLRRLKSRQHMDTQSKDWSYAPLY